MPRGPEALAGGRVLQAAPWTRAGPGSFPRAQVAALESLRQRAPAPASLPIGAGELGTLPPARPPAFQPPRARPGGRQDARAGAPEPLQPIGAAGQGDRDARVALEGTSLRSAGKEGADAWRGGVEAPQPEARSPKAERAAGDPAPMARSMARGWVRPSRVPLCAPAVWTAAALLLWTPWTAGKDPACALRASPAPPPLSPGRRADAGAPGRGAPGKAMLRALGASLGPCPQLPGAGSNELRSRDH